MIIRARDLGVSGRESPSELDANAKLLERLESLRRAAGLRDGPRRRVRERRAQAGAGERGRQPRQPDVALLHAVALPCVARRHGRHRCRHRLCAARHGGQRAPSRFMARTTSRCSIRRAASTWKSKSRGRATRRTSSAPRWSAPRARSCRATCTCRTMCSRNPSKETYSMNALIAPPRRSAAAPAAAAFPAKNDHYRRANAAGGGNDAMARTDRAEARAAARPERHRRQPRRRERFDCERVRRPRGARRPHADARLHRHARHEPGAAEAALRPGDRLRAGRPGRLLADADGGQCRRAGARKSRTW